MTKPLCEASASKKPPLNGWFGICIMLVTMTVSFVMAYAYLLL